MTDDFFTVANSLDQMLDDFEEQENISQPTSMKCSLIILIYSVKWFSLILLYKSMFSILN